MSDGPSAPHSVSVVMATYNGEDFVEQQLASLECQTVPPFELIVSDDGSLDRTVEIVEKFAASAPFPVHVRRNPTNLGYGENFLTAAALARGELVAFCDQDDVWHPEKIRIAVERIRETGALLFLHPATLIDESGERAGTFLQGLTTAGVVEPCRLSPWGVTYGCMMVFRTSLLTVLPTSARGRHTFEYDRSLSHDLWIYFLATSLGRTVIDGRALIEYRQHGGNATPTVRGGGFRAWTTSLGTAASSALSRDEIALSRAALLTTFTVSERGHLLAAAAARAGLYWSRIAGYERNRVRLYEGSAVVRVFRCLSLVVRGAYRPHDLGGLGARIFVKDVLAGVLGIRRRP